jgi:hypothetical protein
MKMRSLASTLAAVGVLTLPLASDAGGHLDAGFHGGFSGHSSNSAAVHGPSSRTGRNILARSRRFKVSIETLRQTLSGIVVCCRSRKPL